jgi:hypothetical protein
MASSDQVPCTPVQEPIHNINGILKAQKSEEIFAKARGVGGGSGHLTKYFSDCKDILQSANQFITHHRRLAPSRSQMRQKADIVMKNKSRHEGLKRMASWHGTTN